MIVFYFAGINMNALIRNNLESTKSWDNWRGTFDEVKDYLIDAFQKGVLDFEASIKDEFLKSSLSEIVRYLCFPIPEKRGHKKNQLINGNQYELERFISMLSLLHLKARYNIIHN
ncbi:hypothetical protein [Chitinophaga sancti]|uniref:Uncharacterized protein n=1 Tax=Chitinophaga sancti TaxID=1004 RepID=A0A1K1SNL4_9BACT|nr:hypothetical protein [Chitinophaga sancti]WQD60031.1 hypothetical protein U0033_19260 [Chitinophaga sancti]WQG87839.1 hypothetical protein SR876_23205 [Chitinophaga sancti]SFW85923.1 hypothetical protein SAMN05661012_05820 [Chitinophaga sancti]